MTSSHPLEHLSQNNSAQDGFCLNKISEKKHSYHSLGQDYSVDIELEHVPDARLVLFNKKLAQALNFYLPESNEELEQVILENFAWFKYDNQKNNQPKSEKVKTFFATRYQDSDDKSEGSALGDGRASWVGEIINERESGKFQYFDVVLKGTGITPLAWLNHPKDNHKDGQTSLTEVVHEYIYSLAANTSGISTAGVLAVIELPFYREVDNEKAAIIVRVGNHLRFAHYCYFADNPIQLKQIFEYGLKRDMGLSLAHSIKANDVQNYLNFIINNLARNAAIYFDIHAVHGSPTFGNISSCGGSIDLATFVFIDAHHSSYSYMSEGENLLGGEWGQTEQFFNLFSTLVSTLKKSGFKYTANIMPVEYFLRQFNHKFEQVLTTRWLLRIGLSIDDIDSLSIKNKEGFYDTIKLIYQQKGSKKIQCNQGKLFMAAFEPRKILSATADYLNNFNDVTAIWEPLFKVNRAWATYKLADAKPYIKIYQASINAILNELNASKKTIAVWQQRSKAIRLSIRNEPGADFFYHSERFFASQEVLRQINLGTVSWSEISKSAEDSALKLVDDGIASFK